MTPSTWLAVALGTTEVHLAAPQVALAAQQVAAAVVRGEQALGQRRTTAEGRLRAIPLTPIAALLAMVVSEH